ncbi:MAG: efflux transporter outer membrane subunit [Alphaproteobacteria bacterium]|nr:efflux transporter outer membrane subunit [Alphaproteobacteria bacterium]
MPVRLLLSRIGACLALLLAGCAVGPDFARPGAPAADRYTAEPTPTQTASADTAVGAAQHFLPDRDIPGEWWQLFHSPALDALVREAMAHNPDLAAAQAALRQARETRLAGETAFFPLAQANFSGTRNKTATATLSPATATGNPYYSLYTPQVTVSYTPDVFGGTRRQVEALLAQEDVQRFQLEATYLTLTSNLVAAAVQEAALRGQIAANNDIVKAETEALAIFRKQLALGNIAGADVAAQEAALAQAQAALPPLQKQLAQQRNLIAALIGHPPSAPPDAEFDLASLQLPQDLPLSLPSRLVDQRPDIRSAEAQLHAASAQIGVAIANMLPQITLSADAGTAATTLSRLFVPGTGFWTLGGSAAQTIFDAGALLHKKRAADAAFDQAAAQYRSTVLTAFQNVADTLRALQADADALRTNAAAEHAAAESLTIARRQLQLGAINYLGLLTAEQTEQQARIALVQAQAARYADTVALFQALGGGWWNRADPAASSAS